MAVNVKSSVCFVGLNCKCFEGRACLLCVYMWVCIFIQLLMQDMQSGAASMQSRSFLSCSSLEKCSSRPTEVDSDSDLNTGAIQRQSLLWASEHKYFPCAAVVS